MVRRLVFCTHKKIQCHYWQNALMIRWFVRKNIQCHYWQNALMIRRFVRKKIQCYYWMNDWMIRRFVRKKLSRVTSCWTWPGPNIWGNLSWKGLAAQLMTKSNYPSFRFLSFLYSFLSFFLPFLNNFHSFFLFSNDFWLLSSVRDLG